MSRLGTCVWSTVITITALMHDGAVRAEDEPGKAPTGKIEVLVEGDSTSVSARDPSAASYVLRADRLHVPGRSAADALAMAPGVQVSRAGASSDLATASIRGATSAQTPIYLAGVRINDDITGTADLSQIPLWMVQRVEIFRGNAPEDADRQGIGGAVFFEPILPRDARHRAGLGFGSFGEITARAASAVGDRRAGAMIALEQKSANNDYTYIDDLRAGTGTREKARFNADFIAYDLWSIGRYDLGGATLTAISNGFVRDQGVTGLTLNPAKAARSHVQRWLGALTAVIPCASGEPPRAQERCRLQIQSAAILARRDIDDPLGELSLQAPRVASRGARVSEQARLRLRVGERLTLGASAAQELERLDIDIQGKSPLRALRAVSRASASGTVDLHRRFALHAVGALEHHATRATSPRNVLAPTTRLGAKLSLPQGVTLLGNVGRYVRVPTLGELYGVSPVVQGNPMLAPETSVSVDLGARISARGDAAELFAELFGFARFASDLIAYNQSSPLAVRPFNVASARMLGLELSAGALLFQRIRAELALTLLDPRDTSSEGQAHTLLPYRARLVAAPFIELYSGPLAALELDRASLGVRLNHRSKRIVDPAQQFPAIVPQTLLDLEATLLFANRRVRFDVRLANLLGTRSSDVLGLPLPGRSIHGALELGW